MAKPLITDILKAERLSMANPIAYCGHHCGVCVFKFCGGCRCDHTGNSYKAACGGVCPNVECAKEKGLEGCYDCCDLPDCQKGYYAKPNEYTAKAAALFIKKYGGERYTATLKKAVESGEKYPKSFDKKGGVENALALLESYL